MKHNQKGMGIVEVLVVVVVIGLLGAVGWLIFAKQQNKDGRSTSSSAASKQVTTVDSYEGWSSYAKNGLDFKHPADWKLDEQVVLRLTSADFASTGVQQETVTAGTLVAISQTTIPQKEVTVDTYQDSSSAAGGSDFKTITIRGKEVVQYTHDGMLTTVFFRSDGTRIQADVTSAAKDSETGLKTYNLILATVKID